MRANLRGFLLLLPIAVAPASADADDPLSAIRIVPEVPITETPITITDLEQIARTGVMRLGQVNRELSTNDDESSRGTGAFVYPGVAPAVVLIQTAHGHGTGFFIRNDGWLLTNRHVIQDANFSVDAGGQIVQVNIGLLDDDGWMRVVDEPLRALVYSADSRRDLALIRLLDLPPGMDEVPFLTFADNPPRPGTDCVAIGHPAAGTLWTLRTGELAGAGEFPRDQMSRIVHLLNISSAPDRSMFEESMLVDPDRKQVLLSTCGLNPGDSGGPLVNEEGEVVAVSFAVPTIDAESSVDLGSFSFHIHLDEVQAFLEDWPDAPVIDAPSPLPAALYFELKDADQDGFYDTLLMADAPVQEPVGILLDLDGDSFGGASIKELETSVEFFFLQDFDFEFCVSVLPRVRISYDRDNDGEIDLVFSDEDLDEIPETEFSLVDGAWSLREATGDPVNPKLIEQDELRKRLSALQAASAGR